ncbi:putative reverse transcriptase domain-containing protein, partial [Tanacetum coccineum]
LVAYRLRLPEELSSVHDTFHVSNLKKCLADANLHVPLDEIKDTLPILLSFTHCGNKSILRVLRIILVILPEHPSETKVFHNEDGNPARANIKQALGSYERSHKGVKASANSDIVYFFTSAQDGDPLQDDVRLCLGDDLKKAQDHNQRQVKDESKDHYPKCTRYQIPLFKLSVSVGTSLVAESWKWHLKCGLSQLLEIFDARESGLLTQGLLLFILCLIVRIKLKRLGLLLGLCIRYGDDKKRFSKLLLGEDMSGVAKAAYARLVVVHFMPCCEDQVKASGIAFGLVIGFQFLGGFGSRVYTYHRVSDMEMMKKRFSKLLLGEDMSGVAKVFAYL